MCSTPAPAFFMLAVTWPTIVWSFYLHNNQLQLLKWVSGLLASKLLSSMCLCPWVVISKRFRNVKQKTACSSSSSFFLGLLPLLFTSRFLLMCILLVLSHALALACGLISVLPLALLTPISSSPPRVFWHLLEKTGLDALPPPSGAERRTVSHTDFYLLWENQSNCRHISYLTKASL